MKRSLWMFSVAVVLLGCLLFVGSGFNPREDVYLKDYSVSGDGTEITLEVGVSSSMGYVRDYREELGGFNSYLTFYTPFGGFNSAIGAKDTFCLEIDPVNCDEVYFYRGGGGYALVLQKDPGSGMWERTE